VRTYSCIIIRFLLLFRDFSLQTFLSGVIYNINIMSQLDSSLESAVYSGGDSSSIITNFNNLYSGAVYPPVEQLQTLLLVAAVESKHIDLVKALLNIGFPVNYKFGFSSPSPLHAAVFIGDVCLIQLLLSHNASVSLISRATLQQSDKVSFKFVLLFLLLRLLLYLKL